MLSTSLTSAHFDSLVIERCAAKLSVVRLFKPTELQIRSLSDCFGVDWPVIPNTADTRCTILWMSPQEWLIDGIETASVRSLVSQACEGALHDVSDMSAAYAKFDLSGANAQAFMAKSCSLDFHSRAFNVGSCRQSLFAQVAALIARPGPECRFTLYAESSLAEYLESWLMDAAAEYSSVGQFS